MLSNIVLSAFKNTKLLGYTFNRRAQDLLGLKVYNNSDFFYIDYLRYTKTT